MPQRTRSAGLSWLVLLLFPLYASSQENGLDTSCGDEIGLMARYDPAVENVFTPAAIADFAVNRYFSFQYGDETRQAWKRHGPGLAGREPTEALVEAVAGPVPGAVAEDLLYLAQVHYAIALVEGVDLSPEMAARLSSRNWEGSWREAQMTHEEYLNEFRRIAAEYMRKGDPPGIASTRAYVDLINRLDRQHTGRNMQTFDPNDWQTIAMRELGFRFGAHRPVIEALDISGPMNRYGATREKLLRCLAYEQHNWFRIGTFLDGDTELRARVRDGRWCRATVDLHFAPNVLAVFDDLTGLAQDAASEAGGQCPQASAISLSGWIDEGRANIVQLEASKAAGWRPAQARLTRAQLGFVTLLSRAGAGDARAQVRLSQHYEDGHVVARNTQAAFEWMEQAAERGLPIAQADLARLYEQGVGTPRDRKKAEHWVKAAAATGDPVGLWNRAAILSPFSSPERFLESYESGYFVTDLFRSMVLDTRTAAAKCKASPFVGDSLYQPHCEYILANIAEQDRRNEELRRNPPPEYTPRNYIADPVIPWSDIP